MSAGAAIQTLTPEEISRFLMRTRRESAEDSFARLDVRLDEHLREVLLRADGLVPSEGGAILLDDPRTKRVGQHRLTVIARFGKSTTVDDVSRCPLGTRLPAYEGFEGTIYRHGVPLSSEGLIGVPVVIGKSICGVLELWGRRSDPAGTECCSDAARPLYTKRDLEILRIFAAYISSSIQNALDAIYARELTRRDNLTGLYNDRFMYQRLIEEIERTERPEHRADTDSAQVSLLFLDIDEFKRVNDTYGHLAGSRTLQEVGQLLFTTLPQTATCARYGGDEFVAILTGSHTPAALSIAENLRSMVERTPFLRGSDQLPPTIRELGIHVTCSIGVANYHDHVSPIGSPERRQNALLQLADTAMYAAKMQGKNRVELSPPED